MISYTASDYRGDIDERNSMKEITHIPESMKVIVREWEFEITFALVEYEKLHSKGDGQEEEERSINDGMRRSYEKNKAGEELFTVDEFRAHRNLAEGSQAWKSNAEGSKTNMRAYSEAESSVSPKTGGGDGVLHEIGKETKIYKERGRTEAIMRNSISKLGEEVSKEEMGHGCTVRPCGKAASCARKVVSGKKGQKAQLRVDMRDKG